MTTYVNNVENETKTVRLVCAAQNGDRTAFGQLFERYQGFVYAIALKRLRDHADAQELVQDVFVKVMLKLDQVRDPRCFTGWLRTITNNMAINRAVRRAPVTSVDPELIEATYTERSTPLSIMLDGERRDEVRAGLNRLRDMDRETLVAFYVNGQSLREMSDRFDAPVGTIKRRLHVARKRLSEHVEETAAAT